MNRLTTVAALLALVGTASTALAAPPGVEVIAGTGTPSANGVMSSFYLNPCISDAGHVRFYCRLAGTALGERDDYAGFRASPASPADILEISREGDLLPDGNGMMDEPNLPSINAAGLMCGVTTFTGTSGGEADNLGVVMSAGGPLTHIARRGTPMPDNDGTYSQFDDVHVNAAGQITFWAISSDTQSGVETGIYRSSGGPVTTLFRTGDPAPGGIGVFDHVWSAVDAKSNGTIAFRAVLDNAGDQLHDGRVYRHANGITTTIAREGDLSPDANGQLWDAGIFFPRARVSDNGLVAFRHDLLGTAGGTSDNVAIFRGSGGPLTMIARKGQTAPGGNGTISQLYTPSVVNSGATIFEAEYTGTTGGEDDNEALLSGNGTTLTTILREDQPTPSGDGQFDTTFYTNWNSNAVGEMAITTFLRNTQAGGSIEMGLYFYRPGSPLLEIARNGTPMLGSTISYLAVSETSHGPSINQSGQLVFGFILADGREGIARFTPPPACLGDFNNDGERNTIDLTIFLGKFGQVVAPYSPGDMNGDGAVNTQDLTAFLGVFGIPCR